MNKRETIKRALARALQARQVDFELAADCRDQGAIDKANEDIEAFQKLLAEMNKEDGIET